MKPRVLLAYSLGDPAGRGAAESLLEARPGWRSCSLPYTETCMENNDLSAILAGYTADTIELDMLDDSAPPETEAYIVLSRHSGGKPSLTTHYPGNPGPQAPLGGRPRELAHTWPRLMAALLRSYHRVAEEAGLTGEFQVTLEATHHGPTNLSRPIVFIEIGSSENEWSRRDTHQAMAEAVARVLEKGWDQEPCSKIAIGVGDTHYPRSHTKMLLEKRVCYTHIFSKHVLAYLDEAILKQALEKTREEVTAVLAAKVPGKVKKLLRGFAEKHGLSLEKP